MFYVSPDGTQTAQSTVPVEGAQLRRLGWSRHDDADDAAARARHVRVVQAARQVADGTDRPNPSASKQEWARFATGVGVDTETVEAMTRDQLAAAFAAPAAPTPEQAPQTVVVDGGDSDDSTDGAPATGQLPGRHGRPVGAGAAQTPGA